MVTHDPTRSLKNRALCRISKIVDKELEASEVFRKEIDKTELMETCSRLMEKKVHPQELLLISEEELTRRIGQMMTARVLGGLLDGLTPEEIEIFNAAAEGR